MDNQYFTGFPNAAPPTLLGATRTVYLGNIPSTTLAKEIIQHVHGCQIESVKLLPEKNCAFVSFLDNISAICFHSCAILSKLSIDGQEVRVGWGKSSQVPQSIWFEVQYSRASRTVYLGNLPTNTTEDDLVENLRKSGPIDIVKIVKKT